MSAQPMRFRCTKCPRTLTKGRIASVKKPGDPAETDVLVIRWTCECRPHELVAKFPLNMTAVYATIGTRRLPWENPTPPMSNEDIDKAVDLFAFDLEGLASAGEFEAHCNRHRRIDAGQ